MPKPRVAVIGGGVSGISCLWSLQDSPFDVHLFEADERLGGHAHTVDFEGGGQTAPVDTGFIAMNREMYPNFSTFLDELGVETMPTDMSFGVSRDDGELEWSSVGFTGFFAQISNLFRPKFWRMIFDIVRFNFFAVHSLPRCHSSSEDTDGSQRDTHVRHRKESHVKPGESIGDYLTRQRYSKTFIEDYLIPMVAAPWCIDPVEFENNFPAENLIRFMWNHRLLDTHAETLRWQTIKNGSRSYIDAFQRKPATAQHIHLGSPIAQMTRTADGKISLLTKSGHVEVFDHIVLATHAGQALDILGDSASDAERRLLSQFRTVPNTCVLHSDESVLPHRPAARAAWNCSLRTHSSPDSKRAGQIALTFDMNRLQNVPMPGETGSPGRTLISMNPITHPAASTVQGTYTYYHPLFSSVSVRAAHQLRSVNGIDRVSFAGAWMGYGFHEDGFSAGLRAGNRLLQLHDLPVPHPEIIRVDREIPSWTARRLCFATLLFLGQAAISTSEMCYDGLSRCVKGQTQGVGRSLGMIHGIPRVLQIVMKGHPSSVKTA